MDLKFCKNIGDNNYELILHGEVGERIIGADVANEINYLNIIGAESITERINTIGGAVVDAFSVVSANLASKARIITVNEGVADSSGGFILASGDKGFRKAYDYSTMLIHNISVGGVMLEDMPDSKLKTEVTLMRDSIVTILSNNSNKTPEEITAIMEESKRLTSTEAMEMGFIDEVLSSIKKPVLQENLNSLQIMNICKEFHNKDKKTEKRNMETVFEFLNLNADASEASALSAIQAIDNKAKVAGETIKNLTTEKAALENKVTEKDAEITKLQSEILGFKKVQNKAAVDTAINSGKFSEDNREALEAQVDKVGIETFNAMVDMVKMQRVDLNGKVGNSGGGKGGGDKDADLAAKYQELIEGDPQELTAFKNESPEKFEAMQKAWNK